MIYGFEPPQPGDTEVGALTSEIRVRVLNCSGTGCLVETNAPVAVGTVAVLRIAFGDHEFDDTVQVVRCHAIEGAGNVYHVGTKFLATAPAYAGTLRYVMRREINRLAGWLRAGQQR